MRYESPMPSSATARWVAVAAHPHKERVALDNLARQGFPTYCPMLRVRVRHARKSQDLLRPLFPGYLFASVEPDQHRWRPILSTLGVRSLVRSGDRPSYLPDAFVRSLQAREVDGAIARPAVPFQVGQPVRLTSGSFAGLIATIIEMHERDRLVVLLGLLNRPVKVSVEASMLTDAI